MDERPLKGKYQTLPGGKYIVAYHVGHWINIGQAYWRLLQYKEENHLKTENMKELKELKDKYLLDTKVTKIYT